MHDGLLQIVVGMGTVAPDDVAVADDAVRGPQNPSVHRNQPLDHLENTPRPVRGSERAVEQGLIRVIDEAVVIRTSFPSSEQVGAVARCTDYGEHLSGRGINGDNGTALVGHDSFAVCLEVKVKSEMQVLAWDRHGVQLSCLGGFPKVVSDVHDVVPGPACATQAVFPLQFQTGFALVISEAVPLVGSEIVLVYFSEFSDQVTG